MYGLWCRLCQTFYKVVRFPTPCHLSLDPHTQLNHTPTFRFWTIKNWWFVYGIFEGHPRFYGPLAYSKITSSKDKFILDLSLLTTLVDRRRRETHTFHLRCWELAPTLKYVSLINVVPISVKPLVPVIYSSIWQHEVSDWIGMKMLESTHTGGYPRGVPLN